MPKRPTLKTTAMLAITAMGALTATAQINYVDATSGASGNTKIWDVGTSTYTTFTPASSGTSSGMDGLWRGRTGLASSSTVFETGGSLTGGDINNENGQRLATTIGGLTPGASYALFAYFWDSINTDVAWRIQAGLTDTGVGFDLPVYTDTAPATQVLDFSSFGVGVAPTVHTEADRRLWQASLGTATADGSGNVVIYIDDDPATRITPPVGDPRNFRTWYDGVGFQAVPEPTTAALAGLAAAGMVIFRRRRA